MKNFLSVILIFAIAMLFPLQVSALPASEDSLIKSIADDIIYKSADITTDTPIVTYSNIDKFVNEVHTQLPQIDNRMLAEFLIEYTEQDSADIPDEDALTYLNSKEIVIGDRFIKIDADGNEMELDREQIMAELDRDKIPITLSSHKSDNKYLQLKTVIARQSDVVDGYVDYRVGAYATWLKMPKWHAKDTLILDFSDSVVFDSTQKVYGKLEETIKCHGIESHYKSQIWKSDDSPDYYTNKNVEIDNHYFGGAIQFKLKPARKIKCDCGSFMHRKKLTSIQAYVSCGISVEAGDFFNLQVIYGHTKFIGIESDDLFNKEIPANVDVYISEKTSFTAYGN